MRDTSKPKSKAFASKQLLSRRGLLEKSLVGTALACAAVLTAWAPLSRGVGDDLLYRTQGKAKVSKASARYQDSPNGDQQCSKCTHFRNGSCEIVEGQISPNGWCRHFKAKSGGGSSGRRSGGSKSGGGSSGGRSGGSSGY